MNVFGKRVHHEFTPVSYTHLMFDAIARYGFDYAVYEEFAPQIERLTGISIDAAHRYGRPMGPQPAEG